MTLLFIASVLVLVLLGAPLFVVMGGATALCFLLFLPDYGELSKLTVLVQSMESLLDKPEFAAIPLFMASGAIMTTGGIAQRLVNIARTGLCWLPGGLGVASIVACMFFASISGSSPVTLIAVGSIMFPAMTNAKYPENFGLGLVTTAGSLGCLVPPSISMLFYALAVSGASPVMPEDLFLAGLVPALFVGGLLAAYSIWVGRGIEGSSQPFSRVAFLLAVREGAWALALPVLVLGGIYSGFFTPSEAGAAATIYALAVTGFVYRQLDLSKLRSALTEQAILMGTLILVIVLTFSLNAFLTEVEIQTHLLAWIRAWDLGPVGFLLFVNIFLIVVGALMDSISCTLLFAPMLAPIATQVFGIDPLHFGLVFVVNMEIGYLMPPVATNLFVASAVFRKPFTQVTRAVLPTLAITCVALVVLMYVPTVSKAAINFKRGVPIVEHFPFDREPVFPDDPAQDDAIATGDTPSSAPPAAASAPHTAAGNLADLTAKSMEAWDDEADAGAAPAPTSAPEAPASVGAPPSNLKDLTRKAMEVWDEE
jgi:C4-dicarboxylate transporter DctM subunit